MTGRTFPFHYGWVIVFSGLLAIIGVLGLGRFSLGMLLPSMGRDLGLSYSEMGFIGTINFIGYLLAVVCCSRLVKMSGYRLVISIGVFLVAVSMIVVGRSDGVRTILPAFFVTGFGSGLANVPVMVLISHWFGSSLRGKATGFMVSGSGLGIMLTGVLVPAINSWAGDSDGWRYNWTALGVIVLLIAVCCALLLRNHPDELGLKILEKEKSATAKSALHGDERTPPFLRFVAHLGLVYFIFGFTYVIYVTFVITTLINDYHFSETVAGRFWFWFGMVGMFSGPLFGTLSDSLGRHRTLGLVYLMMACSHLLLALHPFSFSIYVSIAFFALCAWSIPSIVAAAVGDCLGPLRAASGFAMVTFLFGIGQIAGPAISGMIAEAYGSFAPAYVMAACLTAGASLLSLALPKN